MDSFEGVVFVVLKCAVATCRMAFRDHGSVNGATHRCLGYAQAFGSPTRATYRCLTMPRCLDPQPGLRTGVWIPNRGYTQVFGVPTAATHGCLESPTGATHRCLESQTGDPASCQCAVVGVRPSGPVRLPKLALRFACLGVSTRTPL